MERPGQWPCPGGLRRGRDPALEPPWPAPLGHRGGPSVLDPDTTGLNKRAANTRGQLAFQPAKPAPDCRVHPPAFPRAANGSQTQDERALTRQSRTSVSPSVIRVAAQITPIGDGTPVRAPLPLAVRGPGYCYAPTEAAKVSIPAPG